MTDEREILSALIDREPVDPDVLSRVLEVLAHRELLVDMVRLRHRVLADDDSREPADAKIAALAGRRVWTAAPWARAAAVFVLLAAGTGGGIWLGKYLSRERPPEPSRIVRMDPIGSAQGGAR